MASAAPAPAADADAPAPVGGEGGGAAANNKAKPKPNNKKKEKKIYELKLHPSNAYASDVALGTSVRKLKDDTPIYLNNLLHECGFVYVWKLPIVIKQGNVVRDDLVVLNVGKSQDKWLDEDTPTSVLNRLHEEKASWAKIGVELDVPSFGAQDPLLPVPALQTLATVKKWFGEGKGTDLATLLCRYRKTARHVDDVHTRTQATENFGTSLYSTVLASLVVAAECTDVCLAMLAPPPQQCVAWWVSLCQHSSSKPGPSRPDFRPTSTVSFS